MSSTSSRRFRALKRFAAAAAALLGGCAAAPSFDGSGPAAAAAIELADVPFFPQTEYQCGPAALATVLAHAGLAVTAEALTDDVYVAGLRGSLQAELLAATRRRGMIPYVLPGEPQALVAELEAERPVLVLQNLGLERVPYWHYAVVVGVDAARERVILRSGTARRAVARSAKFLRTWRRAEHWAFVALTPGELPASGTAESYVRALAGTERLLDPAAAERAHAAALDRWPSDELVLFAAAAQRHAARDLTRAAALYGRLLAAAPGNAAARNNFANVLAEQGCLDAARREAEAALTAAAPASALREAIRDTLASIDTAATTAGAATTAANAPCA